MNLINAFKSLFTKHSVEDILAKFTDTVKELEDHAEAKLKASELYGEWVLKYQKMQVDAHTEVAKAKTAVSKLREFFS